MSIEIRAYTPKDKKHLVRFMEELQDYLVGIDPLKRMRRLPDYGKVYTNNLLKNIRQNNGQIYFAFVDGIPVGCVAGTVYIQSKDNLLECVPTKTGRVDELYVADAYRRQRIGEQLFERMEEYFRKKKCTIIRVEVYVENKSARKFYKKIGYMDRFVDVIKVVKN